jgi:hypothetical protein
MPRGFHYVIFVACFAVVSGSCLAGQTGDIFYDSHYASPDSRPYIAGDRERKADFFPPYQPYMRTDKDMFDHTHMETGTSDMFVSRKQPAPDDKIYNWPKDINRQ